MDYTSDLEIRRQLGIDNWRELSKDKMLRFMAMMPDMQTDVALKVIEQFPSFKDFAAGAIDALGNAHDSTIEANNESSLHVHDAYREIRSMLMTELDRDDMTWDQRKWIVEQIQETGRRQFEKDSENKRFLDSTLGRVVSVAGGIVAIGAAALGGRALGQRGGQQ
ncbi:hypothetical protein [Lapillicoccus jejuensis]|uniref:hypothetical protein n=1 Tax=Lapillicoccus jejuensis TaxID=402171 RepID=UPI00114DF6E5|nr:hypothetical protein [Lapillicoccus jejuensis]